MKKFLAFSVLAIAGLFVHACGSTDTAAPISSLHDGVYSGAGSVWTWTLTSGGTFTAIKKATSISTSEEMNITGTYATFSTGFYKFTVATATGTDPGLPTAGDTAYGFSVPGVVLMVKPSGSSSETLVMPVFSGVCPTFPVSFNWVKANVKDKGSMQTQELAGNATLASATSTLTGKRWYLDGAASDMSTPPTLTGCTDGKIDFTGGFINMTSAGVGIVNDEGGGGDIIAFPRSGAVSAATLANRNFVGLVFIDHSDETKPINISFDANGVGTYTMITDVETGTTSESGPLTVLEAGAGEQEGYLKLAANSTGDSADASPPTMWAAVSTLSGHVAFFATGWNRNADGTAVANDNFSVIAVEK